MFLVFCAECLNHFYVFVLEAGVFLGFFRVLGFLFLRFGSEH